MNNAFKTIVAWLLLSSKDPAKVSLAVKGMVGFLVTWIGFAFGVLHWYVPTGDLNSLGDSIVLAFNATFAVIPVVMTAWSTWATVWGWVRKIYTSANGTNPVLQ